MRDHAFIYNFIGFWPIERSLQGWITHKWNPKGHVEPKLGSKGFFTDIFFNKEDQERIIEHGTYFSTTLGYIYKALERELLSEERGLHICPHMGAPILASPRILG